MRYILTSLILSVLCIGTASAEPFAYITNKSSNNVSVIDVSTNTVVDTVVVGDMPFGVAVTPDGAFVYVANQGSFAVSVIQTSNNTVVATVGVGKSPSGVAVTPVVRPGPLPPVTGVGGSGCALASPRATISSIPIYLLVPAFILISRLWRRRTNQRQPYK